jgi:hypothetical protein
MSETEQLAQDLEFVRDAVERRGRKPAATPFAIGLLWGLIALAGCVFNDFDPRHCWIYWLCVPPVGYAVSTMIGGRQAFALGEWDHELGMRHAMHWSCLFWVGIPIILLAVTGRINGWTMGQLMLLLSGVVYYLAGVHLDRRFLVPGIALVAGAAALTYVTRYAWTVVGVVVCVSLVVSFGAGRRSRDTDSTAAAHA